MWRSLVARFVRVEEVAGSSPATPTKKPRGSNHAVFFVFNLIRAPLGNLIHQRQNPFQIFRSEDVLLATKVAVDHRLSFGLENTLQLLAT